MPQAFHVFQKIARICLLVSFVTTSILQGEEQTNYSEEGETLYEEQGGESSHESPAEGTEEQTDYSEEGETLYEEQEGESSNKSTEEGTYVGEQQTRTSSFMHTKQFQNVLIAVGAIVLAVTAGILASNNKGRNANSNP